VEPSPRQERGLKVAVHALDHALPLGV
jgi:hypothetical protein